MKTLSPAIMFIIAKYAINPNTPKPLFGNIELTTQKMKEAITKYTRHQIAINKKSMKNDPDFVGDFEEDEEDEEEINDFLLNYKYYDGNIKKCSNKEAKKFDEKIYKLF